MTKEELLRQRPQGTKDYLSEEAANMRNIEAQIREIFRLWGYREVITPTFEYYEVLRQGLGSESDQLIFRFFDREGHILGLRSDATTPIARLAATRFADKNGVQRLCYLTNIFRYVEPGKGREREFRQAGIELIGSSAAQADAEVIELAAEVFKELGITSYRFDLGEVSFSLGVLAESGLSTREQRLIRGALLEKDFVLIEEVLAEARLPEQRRQAVEALTRLRGGLEVISQGRTLTENQQAHQGLDRLEEVYNLLPENLRSRVHLDLGLLKDLDYYTGVVFEGFVADLGYTVCSGGRYDRLIGGFGVERPATGFAIGLERLLELVPVIQEEEKSVYLTAAVAWRCQAQELAQNLRQAGVPTVICTGAGEELGEKQIFIAGPQEYQVTKGSLVTNLSSVPAIIQFFTQEGN